MKVGITNWALKISRSKKFNISFYFNYTANKISLTITGFFNEQSGPPKQHISFKGIALIGGLPINLGLWVMPLLSRGNGM